LREGGNGSIGNVNVQLRPSALKKGRNNTHGGRQAPTRRKIKNRAETTRRKGKEVADERGVSWSRPSCQRGGNALSVCELPKTAAQCGKGSGRRSRRTHNRDAAKLTARIPTREEAGTVLRPPFALTVKKPKKKKKKKKTTKKKKKTHQNFFSSFGALGVKDPGMAGGPS